MQTGTWFIFLAALSLPLAMQPSAAEDRGVGRLHPGPSPSDGRSFQQNHRGLRGDDIRRVPEREHHEPGGRRGDHRVHGVHGAHGGAGSVWFYYPGPIYPYPYPYMPPPLYEAPLVPGYWYYCDDPPGYYPYVAECRMPWHTVAPGDTPPPE